MNIKTIKKDNYNLHLIKNNNFKTVLIKTVFWDEIKKEEITKRNILIDNMLFSSKSYPTLKDMAIKKEDLYGVNLTGFTYRKGSSLISELNMSVIEDKYGEEGLLESAINFYFDVLNNPNIENNGFNKEGFNINYEMTKANIKRMNENPRSYSIKKYRTLLNNEIYTYPIEGDIKDLEKITPENLYEYYKEFTKNTNVDIFIIGNFNAKQIENLIDKLYNFKTKTKEIKNIYLNYNKKFTETTIKSDFNQSNLLMGSSMNNLTDHEKKYESLIFNIIYGNSPNSKLFLNVREKHSFAYSIASSFSRLDGTFIISAGISKKNYEETKKEILEQLNRMKQGDFTLKNIKDAKEVVYGILNEINDYQNSILNYYLNKLYLNDDSKEKQKEEIKKITKQDIINVAKKIKIDTILLIEEKDNEENPNK